jgi:hypothetical protein
MKTALIIVAAIAAYLYFKAPAERVEAPQVVAPVAVAPRSRIVAAPVKTGRRRTGLSAQTNRTPQINRLKTGPNAQTNLAPQINRLKTGPNAQTDLTLKRSW